MPPDGMNIIELVATEHSMGFSITHRESSTGLTHRLSFSERETLVVHQGEGDLVIRWPSESLPGSVLDLCAELYRPLPLAYEARGVLYYWSDGRNQLLDVAEIYLEYQGRGRASFDSECGFLRIPLYGFDVVWQGTVLPGQTLRKGLPPAFTGISVPVHNYQKDIAVVVERLMAGTVTEAFLAKSGEIVREIGTLIASS